MFGEDSDLVREDVDQSEENESIGDQSSSGQFLNVSDHCQCYGEGDERMSSIGVDRVRKGNLRRKTTS